MAFSAAFLLAGYEFIRSPSDSLFKDAYGMDYYIMALAVMPLIVLCFVYGYSKLLNKYTSEKTLTITNFLSAVAIALCYFIITADIKEGRIMLFLFREAYIVLLVEQAWSFINNTINTKQARLVNGAILAVSSLGAICAARVISGYAKIFGTESMLLFSVLTFIPAILCAKLAYKVSLRTSNRDADYYEKQLEKTKHKKGSKKDSMGLSLFKKEPILIIILLVIVSSQIYSTIVSLNYQTNLLESFPNVDDQTAYSADIYMWLNISSLVLQLIVVPLVLIAVPLHYIHFFIPAMNLAAISYVFYNPSLQSSAAAFMLFKTLDYSLFRAAKEILYIPLSFEAKFRAKEVIDVFGYRSSKGLSALSFVLAKKLGTILSTGIFAFIGILASLSWLCFVIPVTRSSKTGEQN